MRPSRPRPFVTGDMSICGRPDGSRVFRDQPVSRSGPVAMGGRESRGHSGRACRSDPRQAAVAGPARLRTKWPNNRRSMTHFTRKVSHVGLAQPCAGVRADRHGRAGNHAGRSPIAMRLGEQRSTSLPTEPSPRSLPVGQGGHSTDAHIALGSVNSGSREATASGRRGRRSEADCPEDRGQEAPPRGGASH